MKIKLTDEQILSLLNDGWLSIEIDNQVYKDFRLYMEFGKELNFIYGEVNKGKDNPKPFSFNDEELDKIEEKEPRIFCGETCCPNPTCGVSFLYHYEHCPKCGQAIKWKDEK